MDKIPVYEVKINFIDGSLIYADRPTLLEFTRDYIEAFVDDLGLGERFELSITVIEMTQDELDKLETHPDFE